MAGGGGKGGGNYPYLFTDLAKIKTITPLSVSDQRWIFFRLAASRLGKYSPLATSTSGDNCTLSHALKNTANQSQDYRCIFCGMQRVVFHSTFPSLLERNSLLGSI